MQTKVEENIFEKEFCYSLGINGFNTWDENHPLRKTVVDHNQERIIARGKWEIGDQVNRQLLKWASAGRGDGESAGTVGWVLTFICWQRAQLETKQRMKEDIPGHQ